MIIDLQRFLNEERAFWTELERTLDRLENDPLTNSLSVTVPRVAEWLSLGFGYHVEHHLFPAMSTRHAPRVRALLVETWPERYQSMPMAEALLRLHRTARIYRDDVTLCDPRSGAVFATLGATLGLTPSLRSSPSARSSRA